MLASKALCYGVTLNVCMSSLKYSDTSHLRSYCKQSRLDEKQRCSDFVHDLIDVVQITGFANKVNNIYYYRKTTQIITTIIIIIITIQVITCIISIMIIICSCLMLLLFNVLIYIQISSWYLAYVIYAYTYIYHMHINIYVRLL